MTRGRIVANYVADQETSAPEVRVLEKRRPRSGVKQRNTFCPGHRAFSRNASSIDPGLSYPTAMARGRARNHVTAAVTQSGSGPDELQCR